MIPVKFATEIKCAWENAIVDRPVCEEWNSLKGTFRSEGKDVLRKKSVKWADVSVGCRLCCWMEKASNFGEKSLWRMHQSLLEFL